MFKKSRITVFFALISFISIGVIVWFDQTNVSYEFRQVKKVAPSQTNTLLTINQHIVDSIRPAETFKFPIKLGEHGPIQSLYSGQNQYPFYCMTLNSDLGQPLVDNQQGYGVPVYQSIELKEKVIGYSKDCAVTSRLNYYQIDAQLNISKLSQQQIQQLGSAAANENENQNSNIFRVEQGTINRFIYTLIMPITVTEIGQRLAQSQWNKRLIYQFNGGSGIGYRQGRQVPIKLMQRQVQQLLDGYAVISSSGNRTSYTYNMLLAEDTARRVKKQFTSLYGQPLYTVGIGGSGGGLAQYLIAQNSTGILDGLIPLYSYPDMITQTTYALDCDLLNNYFTFRAAKKRHWQDWNKRQLIEGMNAINGFQQRVAYLQPINQIMAGFVPSFPKGNSECINGYFGLSSFINNPRQGFIRDFFHADVVTQTKWSYWQDLKLLLGEDANGFALSTWDNVGVQYGLAALQDNAISMTEFIDINQKIGGWKPQSTMKAESILTPFGRKIPLWLSLWGNQNISDVEHDIAPRHAGSVAAMQAAYRWGQVFIGRVDLPIIDVRHYLEDELDMHHVSASFYSRLRIEHANGHSDNHVIWISHKDHNPVETAFKMMDDWLLPQKNKAADQQTRAKPNSLQDSCFAANGDIIAFGDNVWDGNWNNKNNGPCQKIYPMYSTSRIQAGGGWSGDLFKCALMPVTEAINQGLYGNNQITDYLEILKQTFPDGVCDYRQTDVGRPVDL